MNSRSTSLIAQKTKKIFNGIWFLTPISARAVFAKGSTSLVDQGVVSATNFLTGVIIGRTCAKEELGLYMLGFSIVLFITQLQTALILTPYMIYSPRLDRLDRNQYTGSVLVHHLAVGCFAAAVLSIGFSITDVFGMHELRSVLFALMLTITFIMFREFARHICFALLRMRTALFVDFSVSLIQISGLLILAAFGRLSATTAYWIIGFASGLVVTGWLLSVRKSFDIRLPRVLPDLRDNWTLGKWVFASGLLWSLNTTSYPWLLTAFHGTATTGVLAACAGVAALGNPALLGFQNFLGPRIFHSYPSQGLGEFRYSVLRKAGLFSLIVLPFSVVLIAAGNFLVIAFYGTKYAGYGDVVSILALNLVVSAFSFPFSRALFTMERADLDFAVNFLALFSIILLGIPLVRAFGPLGVASGLLAGNLAATVGRCWVFNALIVGHLNRKVT